MRLSTLPTSLSRWRSKRLPWANRPRRGQAIVEMAVVAPLIAVLLIGVVECSFLLHSYFTVISLARNGARVMLDGATNCEVRAVLANEGNRRFDFSSRGAVHIVRGDTFFHSGTVGIGRWDAELDPARPFVPFLTTISELTAPGNVDLAGSAGIGFVVVETHYRYGAITRMPGIDGLDISSRTFMRTNQLSSANINAC